MLSFQHDRSFEMAAYFYVKKCRFYSSGYKETDYISILTALILHAKIE